MYRTSTGTLGTIPIGSVDRAPFLLLWPLAGGAVLTWRGVVSTVSLYGHH
jgi:hypothetical protein